MKTRVEITGIDTSGLPTLTHEESMELLEKAQSGDKAAHERFVTANLRLVLSLVQRFYGRKACADDLFQVGCVGLIKAMKNFNTAYNLRFSTYAVPMIIGEIRRYLRDGSALRVSRSLRDRAYKALQVRHDIETAGSREATCEEIAACMDIPVRDVTYALDAIAAVLPAGTLSGAPKIRACQLIGEMEGVKRGVYGGAIGYLDFTGNMDVCIGIRLAFAQDGRVFVRAGAGIVADSVPDNEYQECLNKAGATLDALRIAGEGMR